MRRCPLAADKYTVQLSESDTSTGICFTATHYSSHTHTCMHTHCIVWLATCIPAMVLKLVCEFVCVCVWVRADLESRELMQAGLWQSSCPSARLIMQERHSRPPFILPGGEAVPACSPYHMALAPLSSLTLSTRVAVDGAGAGGEGELLVVWWNATARSIAFFLSSTLFVFSPLSSPLFTSPCVSVKRVRQRKKREKERERNRRPSLLQGDNNSFFFISHRRALTTAVAALGG